MGNATMALKRMFLGMIIAIFAVSTQATDLVKNGSFEEGLEHWEKPGWMKDGVTPTLDKAVVCGVGNASLKLKGEDGKRAYVIQNIFSKSFGGKRLKLIYWIRTEGFENHWTAGVTAACGVERDGKTTLESFGCCTSWQLSSMPWTRFEKEFTVPEGTRFIRVILWTQAPSKKRPSNTGIAWFDGVELNIVTDDRQLDGIKKNSTGKMEIKELCPRDDKGVFPLGEQPVFRVETVNSSARECVFDLVWKVHDYSGKLIEESKESICLPALSNRELYKKFSPPKQLGFYAVKLSGTIEGRPFREITSSFVVVVLPTRKNDPFFGVNGIIMNGDFAQPIHDCGAGAAGLALTWGLIEKERGVYDFTSVDKRLNAYLEAGVKPIGQVYFRFSNDGKTPKWWREKASKCLNQERGQWGVEYYKEFGEFMAACVRRYKEHINEWCFVEEIDLTMEKDPKILDYYVRKIQAGYEAAKRVDPSCVVCGVGVSGEDGQKLPRFRKAARIWPKVKDHLDGMDFDQYISPKMFGPGRTPLGPERGKLAEILRAASDMIGQYGKKVLGIGEKGFSIISDLPVDSPYAKDMGIMLARSYIVAKSVPELKHYLWFTCYAYKHGNHDYGLWKGYANESHHPRPAVAAFATVARMLANTTLERQISLHQDVLIYVFRRNTEPSGTVVALWTLCDSPVILTLDLAVSAELYDLMGNRIRVLQAGKKELELTNSPMFLSSKEEPGLVASSFEKACFSLPPLKGEIYLKNADCVRLVLKNMLDEGLSASISFHVPGWDGSYKRRVEIQKNALITVDLPLTDLTVDELIGKTITVDAEVKGVHLSFEKYVDPILIPKAKAEMKIDGDIAKYPKTPLVALKSIDNLFPVDALPNGLWTGEMDLSADCRMMWDDRNLYMAITVRDDIHVQERSGSLLWSNDSLQFAFDTENDALGEEVGGTSGYDFNDYEFVVAMSSLDQEPEAYCYSSAKVNEGLAGKRAMFPLIVKRVDDETLVYEMAIPWSALKPLKGSLGEAFGFNLVVLDTDAKKTCDYWMGITEGVCDGKNPSAFKTFILCEEGRSR